MPRTVMTSPAPGSPAVFSPRLLNLRQAAAYLGCSYWTVRDFVLAGLIPVVELPPLRAREGDRPRKTLRRVLIDVRDLDVFIESRKRVGSSIPRASETPSEKRFAVPASVPKGGQ
jgi:hypothetical protein